MRKFRNAALAIATATTVAVSGVSIASAEETAPKGDVTLSDSPALDHARQGLDKKDNLNWKQDVSGRDVFGSDSWKTDNFKNLPGWAKGAKITLLATTIASIFGLLVAPAYNFLRYGLPR